MVKRPRPWLIKITRGNEFEQFLLQRMKYKTAQDVMRYCAHYAYVLESGEGSELLQLAPEKRIHVLKSLSALSRFLGQYDRFMEIKRKHGLKWSNENSKIDALTKMFDDSLNIDTMIEWVKKVRYQFPVMMADLLLYSCMIGLRPSECLESIKLIKNTETLKVYYDSDRQMLQHFKFSELFIRKTKCAFISFVDDEIIGIAQNVPKTWEYAAIREHLARYGYETHLGYTRKIYATFLSEKGIPTELVNALQGRLNKDIFTQNYFRPSLEQKKKVLDCIKQLREKLI